MSRAERVADLIKTEIAYILMTKANDHRIGFVSITDVFMTADFSLAKVFVSCLGTEEEKKKSMRGLRSAAPFLRSMLAKKMTLKFMPKLRFIRDDSLEQGDMVLKKLATLNQEETKSEPAPEN